MVNSKITQQEIDVIIQFVKQGGSLLLVADGGGDKQADSNINDLAKHFGFTFENNVIQDSVKYIERMNRVMIDSFEPHVITHNLSHIVHSSGCTMLIDETIASDENIKVIPLANSGLNGFIFELDEEDGEEVETEYPKKPVIVAARYYEGRVIGLGTLSLFSSINPTYGFEALDNKILISNVFQWLSENTEYGDLSETRIISLELNTNLMLWMEKMVKDKEWDNMADIINFAVKYLKDNYSEVLSDVEKQRQKLKAERVRKMLEEENRMAMKSADKPLEYGLKSAEEKILGLKDKDVQTAKAFNDLMGLLSKLTDGELGNVRAEDIQQQKEVETQIKDIEDSLKNVEESIAIETDHHEDNRQVLQMAQVDEEEKLKQIQEEIEKLTVENKETLKELKKLEKNPNKLAEDELNEKLEEVRGKSLIQKVRIEALTEQETIAKTTLNKLKEHHKAAEDKIEKIKTTKEKISELKTTVSTQTEAPVEPGVIPADKEIITEKDAEKPSIAAKKPKKFEDYQLEEKLKIKLDENIGIFATTQDDATLPEIKLTDTSHVDDEIDKALDSLGNMDDFAKKIEAFKSIVKKEEEPQKKKDNQIGDEEFFV
jgi:Arc/MetJ-type ribon-helix-helix transcriptional regulator